MECETGMAAYTTYPVPSTGAQMHEISGGVVATFDPPDQDVHRLVVQSAGEGLPPPQGSAWAAALYKQQAREAHPPYDFDQEDFELQYNQQSGLWQGSAVVPGFGPYPSGTYDSVALGLSNIIYRPQDQNYLAYYYAAEIADG